MQQWSHIYIKPNLPIASNVYSPCERRLRFVISRTPKSNKWKKGSKASYHRPKILLLSIEPRRSHSNETEPKINRTQSNQISGVVVRLVRWVRLPNSIDECSIGKIFGWVWFSSITEPNRSRSNDWNSIGFDHPTFDWLCRVEPLRWPTTVTSNTTWSHEKQNPYIKYKMAHIKNKILTSNTSCAHQILRWFPGFALRISYCA